MALTLEELRNKHPHAKPQKTFTIEDLRERHSFGGTTAVTPQDENIGVGFDAPQQFTGEENFLEAAGKTAQNVPTSAFEFGKNIFTAILNPIDTFRAVRDTARGGIAKAGKAAGRAAGTRQDTSETNVATTEEQQFDQLVQMLNARYGGADQFKETVVEDPVGALADIAGIVSGGGAALRGAGSVGKVSSLTRAGQAATQIGQAIEPTTIAGRFGASALDKTSGARNVAREIAGDIGAQIIPTAEKQVARALDLTQGDLRTIQNKTGQSVPDFVIRNIGDTTDITPEEITARMDGIVETRYQDVRNAISGVDKTFAPTEVPRVQQALNRLQELYEDTPGLEATQSEVRSLLNKENYNLSDVQRTKELLDEADIIFRKSGEVKAGVSAQGLANVRRELREFIENEAPEGIDIRSLNNEVQTAYEVARAIENRATRDLTRNTISLTDNIIGVGLGGAALTGGISPLTAAGLFLTKKALSSPAFRIAVAKQFNNLGDSKVSQLLKQVRENTLTDENTRIIREVVERAQRESGVLAPSVEQAGDILNDQREE